MKKTNPNNAPELPGAIGVYPMGPQVAIQVENSRFLLDTPLLYLFRGRKRASFVLVLHCTHYVSSRGPISKVGYFAAVTAKWAEGILRINHFRFTSWASHWRLGHSRWCKSVSILAVMTVWIARVRDHRPSVQPGFSRSGRSLKISQF